MSKPVTHTHFESNLFPTLNDACLAEAMGKLMDLQLSGTKLRYAFSSIILIFSSPHFIQAFTLAQLRGSNKDALLAAYPKASQDFLQVFENGDYDAQLLAGGTLKSIYEYVNLSFTPFNFDRKVQLDKLPPVAAPKPVAGDQPIQAAEKPKKKAKDSEEEEEEDHLSISLGDELEDEDVEVLHEKQGIKFK